MRSLFFYVFSITFIIGQKISLNSASIEDLKTLPLSENQVADLYDFVLYQGPINDIYDLAKISSFESENINALKSLISITSSDDTKKNVSRISFKKF